MSKSEIYVSRSIQAVLDDGLEALGIEMERMKERAIKRPLIDNETNRLCTLVKATCIMAREERDERMRPRGEDKDLVEQIANALRDPTLYAQVHKRLGLPARMI